MLALKWRLATLFIASHEDRATRPRAIRKPSRSNWASSAGVKAFKGRAGKSEYQRPCRRTQQGPSQQRIVRRYALAVRGIKLIQERASRTKLAFAQAVKCGLNGAQMGMEVFRIRVNAQDTRYDFSGCLALLQI